MTAPVVKLAWLAAFVAVTFVVADPLAQLVLAAIAIAVALATRRARPAVAGLLVVTPLIASIVVLQALAPAACRAGCTVLASAGPVAISAEGLSHGIALALRVAAAEIAAVAVLASIHPADLVVGLTGLRVPYAIAFTLSMTLRLVPILRDELATVLAAQRSRGLRARGFSAVLPAVVPVFVLAVERIHRLSIGLESRGFGASGPRTSWRGVPSGRREGQLALAGLLLGVAGVGTAVVLGPPTVLPIPAVVGVIVVAFAVGGLVVSVLAGVTALRRL